MDHVLFETGVAKAQLELGGMPAFAREPLLFELERERLRFCEQRAQLFAAGAYSTWGALLSNNAGSNLFAAFRSLFSDALAFPFAPSDSRHQPPQQQQQRGGVCQGSASPPPSPAPLEPAVRTLDELLLLSSRPLTVRRSLTLRNAGSRSVFVYGFAIDGHVCEHDAFRIVDCPLQTSSSSEPPLRNSTSSYLLKPNDTLALELEFTPDFTLAHVDATLQLLVQLVISPTELTLQPEKRLLFGERELQPLLEHLRSARAPPPSVSLSAWFYDLWSRVPLVSIVAARMSAAASASDSGSSSVGDARAALQHLHLNRGDLQEFRLRALIPRLGAQHCMAAADRWPLENLLHKLCVPVLLLLALVALALGVLDAKQLTGSHRASLLTLHKMLTSTNSAAAAAALFTVPTRRAGTPQTAASYERERNLPVFDLRALVPNAGDPLSEQQASAATVATGSPADGASQSRMSRTRPSKAAPLTVSVGVGASRVGAPSRARNLVLETADAYAAIRHVGALTLLRVLLRGAIGSLLSALLAVACACARALTGLVVLVVRRVAGALSTLLQLAAMYARAICGLVVEWASLALRVSLDRLVTVLLDWRTMVGQRDARSLHAAGALRHASTSRTSSKAATRQCTKANERPSFESTSATAAATTAAGTAIATNSSASARLRSSSSARLSDSNSERRRLELADDASAPRTTTTARARPSKPASGVDAFHLQANTGAAASAERVAEAQEGGSAFVNDEATSYVADAPRVASARRLQQRGFVASRESAKPESSWNMNSGRLKRKAARNNNNNNSNSNNNSARLRANASNAESRQETAATLKAAAAGERRAPRASSSSADESISDGPESRAHAEERTPDHRAVDEDQPTSAITDSEGDEADVEARERVHKKTPLASPARRATRQPPRRQPAPSSSNRRAQLFHRRTNSKGNVHELE